MRRYAFANGLRTEAFSQSSAKPRAAQHGIDVRFGSRAEVSLRPEADKEPDLTLKVRESGPQVRRSNDARKECARVRDGIRDMIHPSCVAVH
jgi:hypothetical protein